MARKKYIEFALRFWFLTHWAKRLGNITPFRQLAGLIASEKNFRGSFIPVGEEIDVPPGVVAPREVVADFIRRASHRTFVYKCPCRAGEECRNHPAELGCILLGDAARDIDPEVGRPATVEEALERMDEAIGRGLLPMVGHMRIDRYVFGARPFERFITLCFCCECCCIVRSEMHNLVSAYPRSLVKLEGVRVEVGDDCAGCGECVPACPVENIRLEGARARVGEMCLGCGSCARACSRGSISVSVEPGARLIEELRRRVEKGVDIS